MGENTVETRHACVGRLNCSWVRLAPMATFHTTASSFRQGARTLPGEYYTSGSVCADERDAIFARQWNCVGRAARIPDPGDYIVRTVAEAHGFLFVTVDRDATRFEAWFAPMLPRLPRFGLARERAGMSSYNSFSFASVRSGMTRSVSRTGRVQQEGGPLIVS